MMTLKIEEGDNLRKTSKWLLVLLLLLISPIPIYSLWANADVITTWGHFAIPVLPDLNVYLRAYIFIASAIFIVVWLIYLLMVLFRATNKKFNLIKKSYGQVQVSSKAINNFIIASLKDEPLLNNPKVSSKLTNRQLNIKIDGQLLAGEHAQQQFEQYLEQLHHNLQQLLGIQQKPVINIRFNGYQTKAAGSPKMRVQ